MARSSSRTGRTAGSGAFRIGEGSRSSCRLLSRASDTVVRMSSPAAKRLCLRSARGGAKHERMIALVSLKTGAIRKLFAGSSPRYVRGGFLVFRRLDAVHVAPFDLGRLEVTGDPRPVLQDVNYYYYSGASAFDVSSEGALIYTPGAPRAENSELVWLDRQGRTELLAVERQPYSGAGTRSRRSTRRRAHQLEPE